MSDIPKARALLDEAQVFCHDEYIGDLIREAYELMFRKPPCRKTRPRSMRMTVGLGDRIREYAGLNPDLSIQLLGDYFRVNAGRVSEALNGYWSVEFPGPPACFKEPYL